MLRSVKIQEGLIFYVSGRCQVKSELSNLFCDIKKVNKINKMGAMGSMYCKRKEMGKLLIKK